MIPCKPTAALLSLAMMGALCGSAAASYVEQSIRAVAAQPPVPAETASAEDLSPSACWRALDDVIADPATGLRGCEAAAMLESRDGLVRWGGPTPARSAGPARGDMAPDACWRDFRDVLLDPATGLRRCER